MILEGPKEHAEAAQQLVKRHMGNPWQPAIKGEMPKGIPLRVELATDCDSADTWYEAK